MAVLTRTGWIGSSEPTAGATRGAGTALAAAQRGTWTVVVAPGSDFDVRVTGTLPVEASAYGADLASGLVWGLVSDLAEVGMTATLLAAAIEWVCGADLVPGFVSNLDSASATTGAVCCTAACAMWSW